VHELSSRMVYATPACAGSEWLNEVAEASTDSEGPVTGERVRAGTGFGA
jgi:hypothetical protein